MFKHYKFQKPPALFSILSLTAISAFMLASAVFAADTVDMSLDTAVDTGPTIIAAMDTKTGPATVLLGAEATDSTAHIIAATEDTDCYISSESTGAIAENNIRHVALKPDEPTLTGATLANAKAAVIEVKKTILACTVPAKSFLVRKILPLPVS